ncbi:sugar phosphate isomerase/epimerase [Desulfobacula sp.]|uniref:sugar phosphate isomerase/epimerase family protein n=1 Tax=Desulfobacula sp. TaxID=2593537 RepID=UPI00262FD69D|nr:sugar phosphate isomerase/epimerase [Desulfobacula sp.]
MTFKSHIPDSARLNNAKTGETAGITLAVSGHWQRFPGKFDWIADHGFALEYAPDPDHFDRVKSHLLPYVGRHVPLRHHAYFPGFEIGDPDPLRAEAAMKIHFQALDAICGIGSQVVTVHVGLPPFRPLNHDRVKKNLTNLVTYGKIRGIQVNLENLRIGPTSHPEILLEWVGVSGANITMDIGHAVSCDSVKQGEYTVPEMVDLFSPKLDEVHLYESETDTHHAPKDLSILGPIFDRLVLTDCRWWTIELEDYQKILHTRRLVIQYLAKSKGSFSRLDSHQLSDA